MRKNITYVAFAALDFLAAIIQMFFGKRNEGSIVFFAISMAAVTWIVIYLIQNWKNNIAQQVLNDVRKKIDRKSNKKMVL